MNCAAFTSCTFVNSKTQCFSFFSVVILFLIWDGADKYRKKKKQYYEVYTVVKLYSHLKVNIDLIFKSRLLFCLRQNSYEP